MSTAAELSPTVRELCDRFGHDPRKVEKWTDAHARTVLHCCRRDERIALNRQARAAGEEETEPAEPSLPELRNGADFLGEVTAGGNHFEIGNAVSYSVYLIPAPRLKKLAEWVQKLLTEEADAIEARRGRFDRGPGGRGGVPASVPAGTPGQPDAA